MTGVWLTSRPGSTFQWPVNLRPNWSPKVEAARAVGLNHFGFVVDDLDAAAIDYFDVFLNGLLPRH